MELSVITAIRLSTQRVWHTFNYDVTVSNGVNLCCPIAEPSGGEIFFYRENFPIYTVHIKKMFSMTSHPIYFVMLAHDGSSRIIHRSCGGTGFHLLLR